MQTKVVLPIKNVMYKHHTSIYFRLHIGRFSKLILFFYSSLDTNFIFYFFLFSHPCMNEIGVWMSFREFCDCALAFKFLCDNFLNCQDLF